MTFCKGWIIVFQFLLSKVYFWNDTYLLSYIFRWKLEIYGFWQVHLSFWSKRIGLLKSDYMHLKCSRFMQIFLYLVFAMDLAHPNCELDIDGTHDSSYVLRCYHWCLTHPMLESSVKSVICFWTCPSNYTVIRLGGNFSKRSLL